MSLKPNPITGKLDYYETARIVQVVNVQTGEVATGTTIIPLDDSKPQNTEGDEYMTLAITPTNAANELIIEAIFNGSPSINAGITLAFFKNSIVDALAAGVPQQDVANGLEQVVLRHSIIAGTTDPITFKLRAGLNTAGTLTFNGQLGSRLYGGVMASSMMITEVKV